MIHLIKYLIFILSISLVYGQDSTQVSIDTILINASKNYNNKDKSIINAHVNEPLTLRITISTNRWFNGSTKIEPIDVSGLIIKQSSLQAVNFTKTIDGQTWASQQWNIPIYPQKQDSFTIPPITITVQVATDDNKSRQQKLTTQPINFNSEMPSPYLKEGDVWVAASNVSFSDDWQKTSSSTTQEKLYVGDSVTRTVTIQADDTMSILIPDVLNTKTSHQYKIYPVPSELQDKQDRGDLTAIRIEKETYIIQGGGNIVFPALSLKVWDPKTNELSTKVLSGKTFKAHHTIQSWLKNYRQTIIISVFILFGFIIGYRVIKPFYKKIPVPTWFSFIISVFKNQTAKSRILIYRQLYKKRNLLALTEYRKEDQSWQTLVKQIPSKSITRKTLLKIWKKINKKQAKEEFIIFPKFNQFKNKNKE